MSIPNTLSPRQAAAFSRISGMTNDPVPVAPAAPPIKVTVPAVDGTVDPFTIAEQVLAEWRSSKEKKEGLEARFDALRKKWAEHQAKQAVEAALDAPHHEGARLGRVEAFDKWIDSPAGRDCLDTRLPSDGGRLASELENRVRKAFSAGWSGGA